jgi:predicted GNAT family N-acyltransferase
MSPDQPTPQLRWAVDASELELALALRERVFCGEQGVPPDQERDGFDDRALHLVGVGPDAEVVGTLRLIVCGKLARIGRIAVDAAWRRRGVAGRMLDAAVEEASRRGCTEARLAAQVVAVGLYRRAGFRAVSQSFEEAGILHVWMRRSLAG